MRDALVRRRLIGIGDVSVGRCLSLNNHVALVKELNVAILHGVHSFALLLFCSFAHFVHLINACSMEHINT